MTGLDGRDALTFVPVGSHSDSLNISSATVVSIPDGATKVMLQCMDQNARYTLDGTTPTAGVGFQLKAGDPPVILALNSKYSTLTLIEEAATADLQVQFGS